MRTHAIDCMLDEDCTCDASSDRSDERGREAVLRYANNDRRIVRIPREMLEAGEPPAVFIFDGARFALARWIGSMPVYAER